MGNKNIPVTNIWIC